MAELLEVGLSGIWHFLGSCIFLLILSLSISSPFYWLARFQYFRVKEKEIQRDIMCSPPPFN